MGKVKNKLDVVQYSFRLNLNKPSHLKIHKMLQEASEDSYGGISRLIMELLEQYAENGTIVTAQPSEEPTYVTKEELLLNNEKLKEEIVLDVMTRLAMNNRAVDVPAVYGGTTARKSETQVQESVDELDPSAAEMALLYADFDD